MQTSGNPIAMLQLAPADEGYLAALRRLLLALLDYRNLISLAAATLMISLFWAKQFDAINSDLHNYVWKIEELASATSAFSDPFATVLDWVKDELLWKYLLWLFTYTPLTPEEILRVIGGFCFFVFHRHMSARQGPVLATIFLANPLVVDLACAQVRSAVAIAIVITLVDLVKDRRLAIGLAALTMFIHSAMSIVVGSMALAYALDQLDLGNARTRFAISIVAAIVIGIAISRFSGNVLENINDRRANIEVEISTFRFVVFWLALSVAVTLSVRSAIQPRFTDYFGVITLTAGTVMVALDFPGVRFISLGLPFSLTLPQLLSPYRKYSAYVAMALYEGIQYFYWLQN